MGLPSYPNDTMSELHTNMLSMPTGSWIVDELVMPHKGFHGKWAQELQKMRSHIVGQPGHYLLWISIAGMIGALPYSFKHKYMAPKMTGFHLPMMEFPLRNTKEVMKLAKLDSSTNSRRSTDSIANIKAPLYYSLPPHLMSGVQCHKVKVKIGDDAGLQKAIEAGGKEMLERTAGKGFPVLVDYTSVSTSCVVNAVQGFVGTTLHYTSAGSLKNTATEAEVEDWLKKWRMGEERRALVTGELISRGWEGPAVMVIGGDGSASPGGGGGIKNLVMRTCGFCFLINVGYSTKYDF